ncbi:MAG: SAM-dependent methyltransferase [Hyphomicrobiaceae bacterium]
MSGFSPEWLQLREPVDHRSRDSELAAALEGAMAGRANIEIVDLGCGAGSNLRGTFSHLPDQQSWTLVDYDPRLLDAARTTLIAWADRHELDGDRLTIEKSGKRLSVRFRRADLNTELERALGDAPDLVTAAAFFDLTSADFIGRLVLAVSRRRAAFYTVLTYNGDQTWTPWHQSDRRLLNAFHDHQHGDKGFGPAAGPTAPVVLAAAFQAAEYVVHEGDSPWRLDVGEAQLIGDLATGFAAAAGETGTVNATTISEWLGVRRSAAVVGHTDTLALPLPAKG